MDLRRWLEERGGTAHRETALADGFAARAILDARRRGEILILRRRWLATESADAESVAAAGAGARLACVSAARHRGWWMPDDVDQRLHLWMRPGGPSDGIPRAHPVTVHWTRPVAPPSPHTLLESVEDTLAHIAKCCTAAAAHVIWESATRIERLDPAALRRVRWPSRVAAEQAERVLGLSDSGLETLLIIPLREWGIRLLPQAVVAGRRVDLLIGERLIVQVDGFAHHRSAAERGRDVAHDAELHLRGFTVLRFTYAQVVHDWPSVERTIARAVAAGSHLPDEPRRSRRSSEVRVADSPRFA